MHRIVSYRAWLAVSLVVALGATGCSSRRPVEEARPPLEIVDDSIVSARVNERLAERLDTRATRVVVATDEGVVTLSGRVPTGDDREDAEEIALDTAGVLGVRNLIQVGDRRGKEEVH
jgi:osmotically-inducible protein OsmY